MSARPASERGVGQSEVVIRKVVMQATNSLARRADIVADVCTKVLRFLTDSYHEHRG